jgi:hypothetical protein
MKVLSRAALIKEINSVLLRLLVILITYSDSLFLTLLHCVYTKHLPNLGMCQLIPFALVLNPPQESCTGIFCRAVSNLRRSFSPALLLGGSICQLTSGDNFFTLTVEQFCMILGETQE